MRLMVTEGQQLASGVRIIVGSIPMSALAPLAHTPWRDARTKEGYQRKPTMARIAKLMNEIRKRKVDIPTAILINAAHSSWEEALESAPETKCKVFDLSKYNGRLSIVDGQHRVLSLKHLYEEDADTYGDFKLQFVMMLGASPDQELEQFYVVNSTAKSVKTDLALDLLKQRAHRDGSVMKNLLESGQDWKVAAQEIVERLADHSVIWQRRIRLANEEQGITMIPSSAFVVSLQRFLTTPFGQNLTMENRYKIIETYWLGIRKAMPEPFDKPTNYTLQKGIGVWAMNDLLPSVIEVIRSRGESLFESYSYANVLSPMFDSLEGENANAELVSGHEFWLTAPRGGAAGSFSSSAGKRVLHSKMLQLLPKPEVE